MNNLLLTVVLIAAPASALDVSVPQDVEVVSMTTRTKRESCTYSGYCAGYGYNFMTGKYDYHYGYQTNCPGHIDVTVEVTTYRREFGSTYEQESEIYRTSCR